MPVFAGDRSPSRGEMTADGIVHVVGLAAAIVGAGVLIAWMAVTSGLATIVPASIYAFGLIAMLACSAAYNLGVRFRYRELWRRLDHAAIFVMIAGTYTPFTTLALSGWWAIGLTVAVWAIAAVGIVLKLSLKGGRSPLLSALLYIAFGWIGVVAAGPFLASLTPQILALLVTGGAIYTLGTIFHGLQAMPYQRAVWHTFVVAGAALHFSAVFGMMAHAG